MARSDCMRLRRPAEDVLHAGIAKTASVAFVLAVNAVVNDLWKESESQDEDQRRALLRPAPTAGAATAPTPRGSATERAIEYDYLLLGSGSSYAAPIKPAPATATLAGRRAELDAQHVQLRAARTVLIVGGGLVGVELAGELLHFCPWLHRVTVTDMSPEVCAALPAPCSAVPQKKSP